MDISVLQMTLFLIVLCGSRFLLTEALLIALGSWTSATTCLFLDGLEILSHFCFDPRRLPKWWWLLDACKVVWPNSLLGLKILLLHFSFA